MGQNGPRERAVGIALLATLVVAWVAFAGVHHPSRALLHFGLAATLLGVCAWPDPVLARAGRVVPVARASAVLIVAGLVALVPLPPAVLSVVAPNVAASRTGWWTPAIDPEAAIGDLCDVLLPLGTLVAATVWGTAGGRRRGAGTVLRVGFVAVGVVGAAHAFSGATALFGAVASSVAPPASFFAPFIDPNHLGTALVLLYPAVLAIPLDPARSRSERIAWASVALAGGGLLVWIGSSGALVAAAAVGLASAVWLGGWAVPRILAVGGAGAVAVGAWLLFGDPQAGATLPDRVATWGRALRVAPGHWFAGAGGGNFELAQQPLHTGYNGWAHAHQDYLEWVVEHGVVGIVALAVAVVLLRPGPSPWPRRAAIVSIGVLGVGVHALVDFPMQIPFLAMAAAAAWGLRRGAYESRLEVSPKRVRWAVGALAALQLAATVWEVRTTVVERAVALVRQDIAAAPPADAAVWRLAVSRPEPRMREAWEAEQRGDLGRAKALAEKIVRTYPAQVAAVRYAALLLVRVGDWPAADSAFRLAEAQFPGDYRTWVAHALHAPSPVAAERWVAAFDHGAPSRFLTVAYRRMPVGLVWLEVAQRRDAAFANALAGLLVNEGDPDTALLAFELALLLEPSRPPPGGYVSLLAAEGRFGDARKVLATALAAHPDDLGLRIQEARLANLEGDPARAADLFLMLAREKPEFVVDAMRSREKAEGASAALALLDNWELIRPAPAVALLEAARLHHSVGEYALCSSALGRSGLEGEPRYSVRVRQLLRACAGITDFSPEGR